jgi:hypothetical protein
LILQEGGPPIDATRIERDKLRADALTPWQDTRQDGREGRHRRAIDRGEIDRAIHPKAPLKARDRGQAVRQGLMQAELDARGKEG